VINVPTALSLYFASSPALATYDGGAGPVSISYPAAGNAPGSDQNPLTVSGDKITMTFWRPQRAGMGSEPAFMDMGHLRYGVPIAAGNREIQCGAGYYSGLSPTLAPGPGAGDGIYNNLFPLQDAADDAAPDPARVLKFTFDVGGCLRANGVDPGTQPVRLPLEAVDESRPGGTDRTAQTIAVCLPGCTPPSQGGAPQGDGTGVPGGGGTADLAIETVTGSSSDSCTVTINLANIGSATAPPTSTSLTLSGTTTTITTQSLPPGSHMSVTSEPVAGACTGRPYTAVLDSTNAVAEASESNNSASGTL
jgi:hypothetical protein